MPDLPPKAVSGTWNGRLIDIRGYEGEISMRLTSRRGSVSGHAEASIGATHESERQRVKLRGKLSGDRIELHGVVDEEVGVEIAMIVTVFPLVGGGHGLNGTYEVAARGFSPLRGGVIAASKGEAITAMEVHPELVLQRRESAGGAR